MIAIGLLLVRMLCDCFKPRSRLEAEILILRHQLNVLQQRTPRRRLHLRWVDRALFIWLYRRYPRILDAMSIVRPETVVRWHRKGFTGYWRWKSRSPGGRAKSRQLQQIGWRQPCQKQRRRRPADDEGRWVPCANDAEQPLALAHGQELIGQPPEYDAHKHELGVVPDFEPK